MLHTSRAVTLPSRQNQKRESTIGKERTGFGHVDHFCHATVAERNKKQNYEFKKKKEDLYCAITSLTY